MATIRAARGIAPTHFLRYRPGTRAVDYLLVDRWASLPLEWIHVDGDESLPMQLDMERVISVLELPFTDPDTFWKLP